MIDEILKKFNVKYEDLSIGERETLTSWMKSLSSNELTIDKLRQYIQSMKESVENELTVTTNNSIQDAFLKARLRNYLLIEGFLQSPEKARKAIERMISGIVK